jgi:hypothetical protein
MIVLANLDNVPAQYQLQFYNDAGQPMALDFVGLASGSVVAGTLPEHGSVVIQTAGTSRSLSQGFACLTRPNGKNLNGYGIFRNKIPDRIYDYEAVVPFSSKYDDNYVLPFDNTAGLATSMAICNPSTYSVQTVTVAFYDEQGNRLFLDQFTLNPLEHKAYAIPDRWPQTAGMRGLADFQVSPWGAPTLGLRFNWTGPFTSTHTLSR